MGENFILQAEQMVSKHRGLFETNVDNLKRIEAKGKEEGLKELLQVTPGYLDNQEENIQTIKKNFKLITTAFHIVLSKALKNLDVEEAALAKKLAGIKNPDKVKAYFLDIYNLQEKRQLYRHLRKKTQDGDTFYTRRHDRNILVKQGEEFKVAVEATNEIFIKSQKLQEGVKDALDEFAQLVDKYPITIEI